MALTTYDSFISRIGNGYQLAQPIYGIREATTTATFLNLSGGQFQQSCGDTAVLPSLPTGVSAYIPTHLSLSSSTQTITVLVAKVIDLGYLTLDGTTAGVFTDGNAMPTVTQAGSSLQMASAVMVEVTTALSGTPGTFSVTYKDDAGNTGNTSNSQTMTASSTVGSTGLLSLASPDWGVMDISAAARAGSTTSGGVLQFWGIIPICVVNIQGTNAGNVETINLLTSKFNPVRLGAGDKIKLFNTSTAAKSIFGEIYFVGED